MTLRRPLVNLLKSSIGLRAVGLVTRSIPRFVLYHRFAPVSSPKAIGVEEFEGQMRLLRRRYRPLTATAACEAIVRGESLANTVVVTVDDGYDDFYRYALPILQRYEIPATVYVTTGFVDRATWLWPDVIAYVTGQTRRGSHRFTHGEFAADLSFATSEARHEAWRVVATYCEELPWPYAWEVIDRFARELGVEVPATPPAEFAPLTWTQIREMAARGIELGDHTSSHPPLIRCDPKTIETEVKASKQRLEAELGAPVRSFAYPHGYSTPQIRQVVRAAGYANAMSVDAPGSGFTDLLDVRRRGAGTTVEEFRFVVSGLRELEDEGHRWLRRMNGALDMTVRAWLA